MPVLKTIKRRKDLLTVESLNLSIANLIVPILFLHQRVQVPDNRARKVAKLKRHIVSSEKVPRADISVHDAKGVCECDCVDCVRDPVVSGGIVYFIVLEIGTENDSRCCVFDYFFTTCDVVLELCFDYLAVAVFPHLQNIYGSAVYACSFLRISHLERSGGSLFRSGS
ncbi:hypothetical protein BDV25DRAFT_141122 [Aspergillus avenaceus]|uniref:Uncharacterized protein n=1 Tax=Aspergillus avenaceus TaxID=36643 RepID=A0A5N6TSS2_ASPAV|nr:hypothetical protein BDV25DRAFT_141122 [Aspergillus avenaceus]